MTSKQSCQLKYRTVLKMVIPLNKSSSVLLVSATTRLVVSRSRFLQYIQLKHKKILNQSPYIHVPGRFHFNTPFLKRIHCLFYYSLPFFTKKIYYYQIINFIFNPHATYKNKFINLLAHYIQKLFIAAMYLLIYK